MRDIVAMWGFMHVGLKRESSPSTWCTHKGTFSILYADKPNVYQHARTQIPFCTPACVLPETIFKRYSKRTRTRTYYIHISAIYTIELWERDGSVIPRYGTL